MSSTSLAVRLLTVCLLCSCSARPGAADSGKRPVPADLKSFESNGEGMSEAPLAADWVKARSILGQATTTWAALKAPLRTDGATAASVTTIDDLLASYQTQLDRMAMRESETAANAISLLVPDYFDLYEFPVPSDALRLDAELRLTQIQGEYSDWAAAASELTRAKAVWLRIKAWVLSQAAQRADVIGSKTVVADVDAALEATSTAITGHDSAATVAKCKTGLDLVDIVEQVFE